MYKVDCSLADPLLLNWVGLTQKYNKQGKLLKLRDKFQEAWEMGQFKPSISSSFFFFKKGDKGLHPTNSRRHGRWDDSNLLLAPRFRRGIKDFTPQKEARI